MTQATHNYVDQKKRRIQAFANGLPKAATPKDRLVHALAILEQGGITGGKAYSPIFTMLARSGFILKPLHFWSFAGLSALAFAVLTAFVGLVLGVAMVLGFNTGPVAAVINAGPFAILALNVVLGMGFAFIHWLQASNLGLPDWSDL